jgi:peptidoglycan-N-acetylglucosamine deacetylase
MKSGPVIVTTSWDDGHPLDRKLAERLARHGMRGTFYAPLHIEGRAVDVREFAKPLEAAGMEIGAHTLTHPVLTSLGEPEVRRELRDGKDGLEQILGRRVVSFCYPKGRHNRRIAAMAREAGYELARTTVSLRTDFDFDPFRMPVSLQVCPQPASAIVTHALRESNWRGLLRWYRAGSARTDLLLLVRTLFRQIRKTGGILHIWGHSWELEAHGYWETLDQILSEVSGAADVAYLTNSQALSAIRRATPIRWQH